MRRVAAQLIARSRERYVRPDRIALIYRALANPQFGPPRAADRDSAFLWLDRAVDARSSSLAGWTTIPDSAIRRGWAHLGNDPRFARILEKFRQAARD